MPENLRQAPVLDDAAAAQLTALGVQIEQLYGQPMDIEWAVAGGQFAILQARPITALPREAVCPADLAETARGVMYGRTSFAEQIPNPVSPLFATFGLRMADIPTQELMKRFTKARDQLRLYPGQRLCVHGRRAELPGIGGLHPHDRPDHFDGVPCPGALPGLPPAVRSVDPGMGSQRYCRPLSQRAIGGRGNYFSGLVRLYTHFQAGTVPLSTMSEGLFTQFYHRLVRRKGDPAATTFLLGSETVTLRAEKALFDLAAWCRERPALAGLPA